MQRWKQCCLLLLLLMCLAISAQAIPIPQCDPCKPSCQPDKDLLAPVCEDSVQEMLLYKGTVVILYSSGVPVMVCLLMAWTFWKMSWVRVWSIGWNARIWLFGAGLVAGWGGVAIALQDARIPTLHVYENLIQIPVSCVGLLHPLQHPDLSRRSPHCMRDSRDVS
jgi:hypothetical protein